jgi:hypothetical protein
MNHPTQIKLAAAQLRFAREYTQSLLEGIDEADWFRLPEGCPTHLAWQVGHLAMAQYMLTLFRIRGKQPEDAEFITKPFLRHFLKGTTPVPESEAYPSVAEIRAAFDGVYARLMDELPALRDEDLTAKVNEPYAVEATTLGSLYFAASHEMLHAGQIGLLKRLLGYAPIR